MRTKLQRLWDTKNTNDEWWSSFVTSPLAIAVNLLVVDWRWLSPNLLTLFSFITALISAGLIVAGGHACFWIAAALIQFSHILDCMDGQMARYRGTPSRSGEFFDKVTDQVQVIVWFGAIGHAAHAQTGSVIPVFLALAGVAFYSLRGYIKYVAVYTEMSHDSAYLERSNQEVSEFEKRRPDIAGLGHGFLANLRWFVSEQPKVLSFNEGVFIFMLSAALVFDALTPMLWIFAVTQIVYGVTRALQRGRQIHLNEHPQLLTTAEK